MFVSSLVSKRCQAMSICTMTLETVCKIYPRRWHLNGNSYSTPLYIWANYSVSNYLNFIPIFWNVSIWLKYDFYHIFCCNMFVFACPIIARSQCWLFALRANIRIYPQISIFALIYPYLPPNSTFRYLRSGLKVQGKNDAWKLYV